MEARTGGVVLIRVVRAVGRAGREDAPEGTAVLALPQSREVDVVGHAALGEGLGEVLVIDVVPVQASDEDCKIIVPVWYHG